MDKQQKGISIKNITLVGMTLFIYSLLIIGVYTFVSSNSLEGNVLGTSSEEEVNQDDRIESLIRDTFILDPSDTPTIATLSNIPQLKQENPVFYKEAIEGDVVYVFSKLAVLVRPIENKIVSVVYF